MSVHARAEARAAFVAEIERQSADAFRRANLANVCALLAGRLVMDFGYTPEEVAGRITAEDGPHAEGGTLYIAAFKGEAGEMFTGSTRTHTPTGKSDRAPRAPKLYGALYYSPGTGALAPVESLADVAAYRDPDEVFATGAR